MNERTWAFIYKSPGCSPKNQHAILMSSQHRGLIYGVDNNEEACRLAAQLVEEGCVLIELCGGFGAEGARQIIQAIQGRIPVGYVEYFPEELAKLQAQKKA